MSRKARSLQHLDARLRELAAAKAVLEQELDQALGRALRRTREHAPADVWPAVQALLAPHVRNDTDRRALGLSHGADSTGAAGAVSAAVAGAAPRVRGAATAARSGGSAAAGPVHRFESASAPGAQLALG